MGIEAMFGPLLASLGYFVQEGEDLFRTDSLEVAILAYMVTEFGKSGAI